MGQQYLELSRNITFKYIQKSPEYNKSVSFQFAVIL